MIPVDTLTDEASRLYENQESSLNKQSKRLRSLAAWQTAWDQAENGRWTHRLIPDISMWTVQNHGETSYDLTQFLTGHGGYRSYLYRFGLDESPDCPTCEGTAENEEHVFFACPRFKSSRRKLETELNTRLTVIRYMVQSNTTWDAVEAIVKRIHQQLKSAEVQWGHRREATAINAAQSGSSSFRVNS
ncbi:unnamed protein product [Hermetia illucens]|uniref:Reverse transcriptase n=1 Tax=Hermetia illucens TaxID=343691 RepID=A0A7R8UKB0_HERIL|nr:unnamed protein product [Hermetia illucens]